MSYLQKINECYIAASEYERSKNLGFFKPEARRQWIMDEFPYLKGYEDRLAKIIEAVPDPLQWPTFDKSEKGYHSVIEASVKRDAFQNDVYRIYFRRQIGNKIFDVVGMDDFVAKFASDPYPYGLLLRVTIHVHALIGSP